MNVNKDNVIEKLKIGLVSQSYIPSYLRKGAYGWRLNNSMVIELSNGESLMIKAGFMFDMATVPRILWGIFPPYNDGIFAYLLHDFLYMNQDRHPLNRKQSDKELLFWLNLTNHCKIDNYIRFIFVRAFGWLWWKKII